jgi:hypothetical protein
LEKYRPCVWIRRLWMRTTLSTRVKEKVLGSK